MGKNICHIATVQSTIKHIVASRILARDLLFRVSTAMFFSISAVTGAFLVVVISSTPLISSGQMGLP